MPNQLILRFLRVFTTTVLLVYVLHQAGLFRAQGWVDLASTFAHANLSLILIAIGIDILLNFASAVKWYMLARARNLQVGLWRLFGYYMVGKFFNLILPSSVGGDVIRMYSLGRYTGQHADATAVVFVERFTGLVTLVILALVAVVVNLQIFNLPWLTIALAVATLGVGLVCWLIVDERPFALTQKILAHRVPFIQTLLAKIQKFRQAVLAYRNDPMALGWALVNSLIFYFLAVLNVWASVAAFGATLSFSSVLVATPVIMFIMNIPFSIGGIGLMEFAYSFTLGLFGVSPAIAISTALLMRLKSFFDAGMGGLLYALMDEKDSNPKGLSSAALHHYDQETHR